MTDETTRKTLYELAKANGLEPHSRTGVAKLQEMLVEAGIPFDAPDDTDPALAAAQAAAAAEEETLTLQEEIEDDRDALTDLEESGASLEEVEAAREALSAKIEKSDKQQARAKAKAARKDRVDCIVMKKVHIQLVDMGKADAFGRSEKMQPGDEVKLNRALAESLEARGQVKVVG
jgi:hypothetical protein